MIYESRWYHHTHWGDTALGLIASQWIENTFHPILRSLVGSMVLNTPEALRHYLKQSRVPLRDVYSNALLSLAM